MRCFVSFKKRRRRNSEERSSDRLIKHYKKQAHKTKATSLVHLLFLFTAKGRFADGSRSAKYSDFTYNALNCRNGRR